MFLNLLLENAGTDTANKAGTGTSWWIYVVLIVLVIAMLVIPAITNKRRMKEYDQMINNVHVGDTIRTIGGVVGRVTKITEKDGQRTFILETGAKNAKTTMEFDMRAVGEVLHTTHVETMPKETKKESEKENEKVDEKNNEQSEEQIATEPSTEESLKASVYPKKSSTKKAKK